MRLDCVTCHQGDERLIDCRKRNILYESECTLFKEAKRAGKEGAGGSMMDGKGIYVGESSRSIYERSKEHQAEGTKIQRRAIRSSIGHEELLAPPKFMFRIFPRSTHTPII